MPVSSKQCCDTVTVMVTCQGDVVIYVVGMQLYLSCRIALVPVAATAALALTASNTVFFKIVVLAHNRAKGQVGGSQVCGVKQ